MAVGFVLITTAPGKEHEVYDSLLEVPEIDEMHSLFGEYDLIVKIKNKDLDSLGDMIISKIRSIDGIMNTKTLTGTKF